MTSSTSNIHTARLARFLADNYHPLIIANAKETLDDARLRSRALSAYTVQILTGCTIEESVKSITDGLRDNGIDALHYDKSQNILYIIQSKWKENADGHFSKVDTMKYLAGVEALLNERYDKFNNVIQSKKAVLSKLINDPSLKIRLTLVCTTQKTLADSADAKRDIDEYLERIGATTGDTISLIELNINELIERSPLTSTTPINDTIVIEGCHRIDKPLEAYYGKLSLEQICKLYDKFGERVFDKNLRTFLGATTSVNNQIRTTLHTSSDMFWYFNNGITIICNKLSKTALGGTSGSLNMFNVEGINIVNGAQTVGAAYAAFKQDPASLNNVYVQVKLISLENSPSDLAIQITKSTNSQNQIQPRDFVALDPKQQQLARDFLLEGIDYKYRSGEDEFYGTREMVGLNDATVALACASKNITYATEAKSAVSKLWDIGESNSTYGKLFTKDLKATLLYRLVKIKKTLDADIEAISTKITATEEEYASNAKKAQIAKHGSAFILFEIFKDIDKDDLGAGICSDPNLCMEKAIKSIPSIIDKVTDGFIKRFNDKYPLIVFKSSKASDELDQYLNDKPSDTYLGDLFSYAKFQKK